MIPRFSTALCCLLLAAKALPGGLAVGAVPPSSPADGVSFRHEVMAVLAKGGCNSGPCHGNRQGKGAFKLSLRGEDPDWDFFALTGDLGGRRIDRLDPDASLVLRKPTGRMPHQGQLRFPTNSLEFGILRRWIELGAHDDKDRAPALIQLSASPAEKTVLAPEDSVDITVSARFADGSSRDVTRLSVFESVTPIVDIADGGRIRARQPGETTILVRYLNRQVPVRLAFVPERPGFVWAPPASRNPVDDFILAKLRRLRLNASPLCRDEVFIRRASLDLLGVIPSGTEATDFVRDPAPDKRRRLVDSYLERSEFADYWALKWLDVFRSEERALDRKGIQLFREWLVDRLADHTPLDRFVRSIITARGSSYSVPAVNWTRAHRTPVERAEAAAQVFLGTRLQCAQCHNHPYERWTQADYHSWTALFARMDYKILQNLRRDPNDKHEFIGEQVVFFNEKGQHNNPRTGLPAPPHWLGASPESALEGADAMERLAAWMTSTDNPLFARAQANRIWYHLMGRGLVDPVDDFRSTNPASHPELLEFLASELVRSGFDLRHVIRMVTDSHAYQASSEPAPGAEEDVTNYSHTVPRRCGAEVLLDSLCRATDVRLDLAGWPAGTRAVQVPTTLVESRGRRRGPAGSVDVFLQSFGKPARQLATECERSIEPAMSQVFQMVSGPTVQQMVSSPDNRLRRILEVKLPVSEGLADLYWSTLGRAPSAIELERLQSHLAGAKAGSREAWEDVLWSLLNAKEFILRF